MSLRVIGAGLGRTGTASLKVALEQLGVGRCYHMREVMVNSRDADLWIRAADGNPDWDQLLGDWGATLDYPACSFWREQADYYPSAKILLSTRDANKWFESTQATIFSPAWVGWTKNSALGEFFEKAVWNNFEGRIHDREFMVPYFERYVEDVVETVPKERLLVYEVKQGWEPLCEFLGVPVPGTPFPRVNTREDTLRALESMIATPADTSLEQMKERADDLFTENPK